jgi:hypothetical protein
LARAAISAVLFARLQRGLAENSLLNEQGIIFAEQGIRAKQTVIKLSSAPDSAIC